MVKVRFLRDRVVEDGMQGTAHETRFKAGQVVDLPEASANHWISRGVAAGPLAEESGGTPVAATSSEAGAPASDQGHSDPEAGEVGGDDTGTEVGGDSAAETGQASADAGTVERKSGRGIGKAGKG